MILSTLVFSALVSLQKPSDKAPWTVPLGTSSEVYHLMLDIKNAIQAKDFGTAEKKAKLLPKETVTYYVNTKNLDPNQKEEFPSLIRAAADNWEKAMSREVFLSESKSENADMVVSFEPVLAKAPNSDLVAGATWFFAAEPTTPYLETVIGLKRGAKLEKAVGRDVFNEAVFSFGRFFGLAPNPLYGTAMGRYDGKYQRPMEISTIETASVRKILALSHNIRQAIKDKAIIDIGQPTIHIDKKSLEFDSVFQGSEGKAQILITNNGNMPLELGAKGDCGCINGYVQPSLAPGQSTFLTGVFTTSELSGDVHHNIVIRTNDPDSPSIIIPCSIKVKPRAEFIYPSSSTIYMDGSEKSFTFYMNSTEPKLLQIVDSSVLGGNLALKSELFEGDVDDYLTPGKKKHVRGYKMTLDTTKYPVEALFGRAMAMVSIKTDNPILPFVRASLYLQKGIVMQPENLYLGTPTGETEGGVIVTRPGRPFEVKGVSSDSPFLKADFEKVEGANGCEYFIKVVYNGKAPAHRVKGVISVSTNDPKQPMLRIPVQTSGA